MRDTSLLRHRLHAALACLPLAAAGLAPGACGPAATAPQAAKTDAKTDTRTDPKTDPKTDIKPDAAPQPVAVAPVSPYPARTGLDPFDPDGMEEEGCPNGDWCGPAKLAEKFRTQSSETDLGCPTRLMGSANPGVKPDDRHYKGLSLNPMMQGRLRRIATAEQRKSTGDEQQCCYHWFDYCSGRPLLDDELAALQAPLRPGDTWLTGHVSADIPDDAIDLLPLAHRRELAAQWLADARAEHASVAAFARATLELLAVGAPPELVFAAQQAGLDEVRHAQTCFTLAALYAGEAAEPGPLPLPALRAPDLVALACATFLEGCVGETVAALAALRAARRCQVAEVRQALTTIADDEARHAELAWATLAYAARHGGAEVASAVRALAHDLREAACTPAAPAATAAAPAATAAAPAADELPAALLLAHGRLPAAALADARRDAWLEILGPTLDLVLGPDAAAQHADDDVAFGLS